MADMTMLCTFIISLAVTGTWAGKVDFEFETIRDRNLKSVNDAIDFSNVSADDGNIIGFANVTRDMPSPIMVEFLIVGTEGSRTIATYASPPLRDMCEEIKHDDKIYSTILRVFGNSCPIKKGIYKFDNVEVNQTAFQVLDPRPGVEYTGDISFVNVASLGNGVITFAGYTKP